MRERLDRLAAAARDAGFVRAGATPIGPVRRAEYVDRWLDDGRAGEMAYLRRRHLERVDPRRAFAWARTIVSLAVPYAPLAAPVFDWRVAPRGRVAAHPAGGGHHHPVPAAAARGGAPPPPPLPPPPLP